jgi:hypothetical protein
VTHSASPNPAPEELVDRVRTAEGLELRSCAHAVAYSPEARAELAWMSAFEDDLGESPSARAVEARVAIAVEGVLATLDEER